VRENVFDISGLIFEVDEADDSVFVSTNIEDQHRVALIVSRSVNHKYTSEGGEVWKIISPQSIVPIALAG
jgi:hypothetical protein